MQPSDAHPRLLARPARADDRALYLRLLPELGVDELEPTQERWEQQLVPSTWIAERDGAPVGFVYFQELDGLGYVRQLVVDPSARRAGVGRFLMMRLAARLAEGGVRTWCLNVKPDNHAAIALYEGLGLRRAYHSQALRLPWASVEELPGPADPVDVAAADPADDPLVEQAMGLGVGQLREARRAAERVIASARDRDGSVVGVASFDPAFPGSFPFRVGAPAFARPLLEHLRRFARPEHDFLQLVVEDDPALCALLLAHGASVRLEIIHLRGAVPPAR